VSCDVYVQVCVCVRACVYVYVYLYIYIRIRERSPVPGLEWPRVFQIIKVPRFHDNGTGWGLGCHPYAAAAFTPRK